METIHIIITFDNKIWVAQNASQADALRLQGNKAKVLFCNLPCELKKFFRENPEEESLFTKAFAYWIQIKAKGKQEIQGMYGMLKRKLSEFSKKLFRTVRKIAKSMAKKVIGFWYHQEKNKQKEVKNFWRDQRKKQKEEQQRQKDLLQYYNIA